VDNIYIYVNRPYTVCILYMHMMTMDDVVPFIAELCIIFIASRSRHAAARRPGPPPATGLVSCMNNGWAGGFSSWWDPRFLPHSPSRRHRHSIDIYYRRNYSSGTGGLFNVHGTLACTSTTPAAAVYAWDPLPALSLCQTPPPSRNAQSVTDAVSCDTCGCMVHRTPTRPFPSQPPPAPQNTIL
jgi:hypothetical protein